VFAPDDDNYSQTSLEQEIANVGVANSYRAAVMTED
jgi:hypothetical protein